MGNNFWHNTIELPSKSYICGYCSKPLASNLGYYKARQPDGSGEATAKIYICHFCLRPTYFDIDDKQAPGVRPGEDVSGITDEGVISLYNESRDSYSQGAFTATILCCRKLLMHIAVSKGAEKNKKFIEYVEFLATAGYIPPGASAWVDKIRTKGNEANHEIVIMNKDDATDLLSFCTMLLKIIYEFPSKIKIV